MKGRKKRYIIAVTAVIALLIAAFIGWTYLQLHQQQKQVDVDLYTLVPASSEAIIEVQDLKALHENITHSCLERQHFKTLDLSVLATFIHHLSGRKLKPPPSELSPTPYHTRPSHLWYDRK